MRMSREWGMPTPDTFECPPINQFMKRWVRGCSVDPFARNSMFCLYRNDIDPKTKAEYHLDAIQFLSLMETTKVKADVVVIDPPYSPRQLCECYEGLGVQVSMETTQNGRFYKEVRDAIMPILKPGTIVLSFGWNSAGMGKERHFEIQELMLVAHGGAHNDTICIAEEFVSMF